MRMSADLHWAVAPRLRATGQRLTPGRRALLDILARASHPLTIAEILRVGQGLALSSAYRNLVVLEQAGVVRKVVTEEDFGRYELAEDLTEHHHHLVCSSCGIVEDLPTDARVEGVMREVAASATELSGFTPKGHRLDMVGLCSNCS